MGDLVNLRIARKRKARDAASRQAEENRALHGLTRSERLQHKREAEREATFLDAHRREAAASCDVVEKP